MRSPLLEEGPPLGAMQGGREEDRRPVPETSRRPPVLSRPAAFSAAGRVRLSAASRRCEARMAALVDIEAIQQFEPRYFRALDCKRWDDLFCNAGVSCSGLPRGA